MRQSIGWNPNGTCGWQKPNRPNPKERRKRRERELDQREPKGQPVESNSPEKAEFHCPDSERLTTESLDGAQAEDSVRADKRRKKIVPAEDSDQV